MHMAGVAVNKQVQRQAQAIQHAQQVQMQAQLEQQAATQLQMQAQLEQQAALIHLLQMNGANAASLLPPQQPQKVQVDPGNTMTPACAGLPLQQPGMTLRLAAAGMANHASGMANHMGTEESMAKGKLSRTAVNGQSQAKQNRQKAVVTGADANMQKQPEKSQDSMRSYLSDLRNEDPKRVFITRRIKDLGFRSKELLKQHFSKYGEVKQVLIPHTKVKPYRDATAGSTARTRPGNFGLVVMTSPQVVQKIFEEGSEHSVNGVQIEVQVFELVSRPHDRADQTGSETNDASQEDTTASQKDNEGASPSSEEQEVGESRSGGCTEEQPSSSNGQPTEGASQKEKEEKEESFEQPSSSNENGESSEKAKPGDARPMSVGDWRQSRSTKEGMPDETKERPTPKDNSFQRQAHQGELLTDTTQAHNSLTLQNVIGVIQKLYQDASKVDLADEMSQAVSELLSGPEEGQLESCQTKLAKCLRLAADRLRAEADTLQATAFVPPGPSTYAASSGSSDSSFARALAAEVGRFACTPDSDYASSIQSWQAVPGRKLLEAAQAQMVQMPMNPPGLHDANAADDGQKLMTLRSHLKEVSSEDPACIFVARKIHTLGFHSHKKLREHYSQYGPVSRVLVAHRKLKAIPDSYGQMGLPRTRPGSLGLIIMRNAASVQKILALGEEHVVAGHKIRVEIFEPYKTDDYASTTAESSNSDYKDWTRTDYKDAVNNQARLASNVTWSKETSLEMTIPESEQELCYVPV